MKGFPKAMEEFFLLRTDDFDKIAKEGMVLYTSSVAELTQKDPTKLAEVKEKVTALEDAHRLCEKKLGEFQKGTVLDVKRLTCVGAA